MRVDVVDNMKQSIINDFNNYLDSLTYGNYNININHIIAKILFVNSINGLDKIDHIYQKLI